MFSTIDILIGFVKMFETVIKINIFHVYYINNFARPQKFNLRDFTFNRNSE